VKRIAVLALLVSGGSLTHMHAAVRKGYQGATVVSVAPVEMTARSSVGSNPADAPIAPEVFAYDVSLRTQCLVYVGRYESATDYLPAYLKPNSSVNVRVEKHSMYLSLPLDHEVKLGILGHHPVQEGACAR
jgi:hypothetical protein